MAAPAAGSVLYVSLLGDRNITWISNRGYQESRRFDSIQKRNRRKENQCYWTAERVKEALLGWASLLPLNMYLCSLVLGKIKDSYR